MYRHPGRFETACLQYFDPLGYIIFFVGLFYVLLILFAAWSYWHENS